MATDEEVKETVPDWLNGLVVNLVMIYKCTQCQKVEDLTIHCSEDLRHCVMQCCLFRCGTSMADSCTAASQMITQLHLFPGLLVETCLLLVLITR
jgi:hypothetical protein